MLSGKSCRWPTFSFQPPDFGHCICGKRHNMTICKLCFEFAGVQHCVFIFSSNWDVSMMMPCTVMWVAMWENFLLCMGTDINVNKQQDFISFRRLKVVYLPVVVFIEIILLSSRFPQDQNHSMFGFVYIAVPWNVYNSGMPKSWMNCLNFDQPQISLPGDG